MTLELADLDALKDAAIQKLDQSQTEVSQGTALDRRLAQLQAELEQIYRVVVLLQKNETDIDRVAEIWGKMVSICDEFARRLAARACYDRVLDLRNAAEERRQLHVPA